MKFSTGLALAATLVLFGAGCSKVPTPASPSTDNTQVTNEAVASSTASATSTDGKANKAANPLPSKVEVLMDENGFHPAEIRLAKGGSIVFKNVGKTSVWPASSKHPTHLDYPKFDPEKGIKAGETYEIDFPEAKTYFFHDHLNASHFGKVIVE